MSVHLPPRSSIPEDDSDDGTLSSVEDEEEEETWDDWVSDSMEQRPCRSLFDEKVLPSVEAAIAYDKNTHGFDLDAFCAGLCAWSCLSRRFSLIFDGFSQRSTLMAGFVLSIL